MTKKIDANILDALVVFILTTSFISITFLILNIYNPATSVILSLIVTLSLFWAINNHWRVVFSIHKSSHFIPIILLLLIGLLFRSEPYLYIAGGQDQGVYVNMSKYYENYGKIFIHDKVRSQLPDNLKEPYDSANMVIASKGDKRVSKQKEGSYLPGIYVKDQNESTYVFQFYQLHPIWMSIVGKLFGDNNRIYSLVFFSLISLVAFYLLAYEFTQRKGIAFTAGTLLAINPLHAFFSKFPVTEIMALSFTTLSFYYLLKYYNLSKQKIHFPGYLILSSLLMSTMFFTRISGFMYIPFFYLILLSSQILVDDRTLKGQIKYYVFSVFFLYALSVWYGVTFSYPYSSDIYRLSFTPLFGTNWKAWLLASLAILTLFYLTISNNFGTYKDKLKNHLPIIRTFLPYIFLIILALGLYKIYQLGFTDKYIDHQLYSHRFKAAGTGLGAFLYWSVYIVFEYLSPFILIVFTYILFSQSKNNGAAKTFLTIFILLFFIHISLLQWFIPYQYYYARYLVSEALPYILLFTIIGVGTAAKFKKLWYFLIALSAIYMLYYSTMQFKGKEMQGFYESLAELTKNVGHDDVILVDRRIIHTAGEIKTTLVFYFNYNVISTQGQDEEIFIDHFCRKNKNVYLFSTNKSNKHTDPVKAIPVTAKIFDHTNKIPIKLVQLSRTYYLSKVPCIKYISEKLMKTYTLFDQGATPGVINSFYGDYVWTMKDASLTNINMPVNGNKYLVLETFGYNPFRHDIDKLGLALKINTNNLTYIKHENNKYYFSLPDTQNISSLSISSNTFIPKEEGINQDSRNLGIDIKSIKLVKEITQ